MPRRLARVWRIPPGRTGSRRQYGRTEGRLPPVSVVGCFADTTPAESYGLSRQTSLPGAPQSAVAGPRPCWVLVAGGSHASEGCA